MVTVERIWNGQTVVCMATGPSLTAEDVEFCRGNAPLSVFRFHSALCHRQVDGPARLDTLSQATVRNADSTRPFGQAVRLAFEANIVIKSGVLRLLESVGPSAVLRAISGVVVDAVKRLTVRTWPHVVREIGERTDPSITDRDASAAVAVVSGAQWVAAPADHGLPSAEVGSDAISRRCSMLSDGVSMQATATARVAGRQRRARDYRGHTARTGALPQAMLVLGNSACVTVDGQPSENPTGQIDRLHFIASMCLSMMRLTSSAMEMPSRLASRFKNALCGSVNEIICLTNGVKLRLQDVTLTHKLVNAMALAVYSVPKNGLVVSLSSVWLWRGSKLGTAVSPAEHFAWGGIVGALIPHARVFEPQHAHLATICVDQPTLPSFEPLGIGGSISSKQEVAGDPLIGGHISPKSCIRHIAMIPQGIQSEGACIA